MEITNATTLKKLNNELQELEKYNTKAFKLLINRYSFRLCYIIAKLVNYDDFKLGFHYIHIGDKDITFESDLHHRIAKRTGFIKIHYTLDDPNNVSIVYQHYKNGTYTSLNTEQILPLINFINHINNKYIKP